MLFQTQGFILIFLPLSLAAYWLAARHINLRQWILVGVSLTFYGIWDWRFLPLLLGQITISWYLGRISQSRKQQWPIILGIITNLLSLIIFKYLDFFTASLNDLFGVTLPQSNLILPIGISFFSFQLISYLMDLQRAEAPQRYQWREFALFVLLFPHLIAGPIVRHHELIPQFSENPHRTGLYRRMASGAVLLTIGMAKKIFFADRLAVIIDPLFTAQKLDFMQSWQAALGFSFQLLLDFSAYTEMAIGIALLFGFILPENFNRPYLATSLRDFWRRWHITLSGFIRDYLYIPMGGSRHGHARYIAATLGSMAICGLWHGAGWNYVLWGALHGIGLIICRYWQMLKRPMPVVMGWLLTMLFVIFSWVIFRAENMAAALDIMHGMLGMRGFDGEFKKVGLIVSAGAIAIFLPSAHRIIERYIIPHPVVGFIIGLLAAYAVLMSGVGAPVNFIYFQF